LKDLFPVASASPHLEVCVVVPAKDEGAHLLASLQALRKQRDLDGKPIPERCWEVLLLINNTTDDSLEIAKRFQEANPGLTLHVATCRLPSESANVGHARKLLMDAACERLEQHRNPWSLILSTDADTEVAPDWVAQNVAEVRRGADAVGGRIKLRAGDLDSLDPQTKNTHLQDDEYWLLLSWLEHRCDPQAHDPWPRHHQHFGSSFAVTAAAYRQVGGLPPKAFLEDVALHKALSRQDLKFRHSPHARVLTSGRLKGRTAVGLAEQLARWRNEDAHIIVPSVFFWQSFFSLRRQLREVWQSLRENEKLTPSALTTLAFRCGTEPEHLRELFEHRWFGSAFESLNLQERLQTRLTPAMAQQSLDEAVLQLRMRFSEGESTNVPVFSGVAPDGTAELESE
jgi:glycosyltransferase involved in cell wall biosynthesis